MAEELKNTCTPDSIRDVIAKHGGLLYAGAHDSTQDECCVLEARSLCIGIPKTDDPELVGMPDIRAINDAAWSSNELRTAQMLRLTDALGWWSDADNDKRTTYISKVIIRFVNQIVAELPGLPEEVRVKCREASTLDAASDAASAASYAASDAASAASDAANCAANCAARDAASYAASAARDAASYAASAARAASDKILIQVVDIWVESTSV